MDTNETKPKRNDLVHEVHESYEQVRKKIFIFCIYMNINIYIYVYI